jgi:hypothetical protein
MSSSVEARTMSPNRIVGAAFGAIYLLVGAVGFAITAGTGFAATEGKVLLFFELNPLHNLVHLAVGAVLVLAAYKGAKLAAAANAAVGAVYGLVGIAGFFAIGTEANLIALNQADNWLHLASAAVLIGAGLTRR